MPDVFENLKNTDVSNTYVLLKGTAVCVVSVGGLHPMFTMYMAGAGVPGTGGSITTSFDAFAGSATLTDLERNRDEPV